MYYGRINKFDIANGEGVRTTLFVSGCRNCCEGCFQKQTWAFDYGSPFTESVWEEIFSAMENPSVRGLTLLGGEPMEPENQRDLLPFLKEFKRRYPTKTIWLYTGNLYEELTGQMGNHPKHIEVTGEILSLVDVMVDGRYEEDKHRLGLLFRGSSNQRIINVKESLREGRVIIYDECGRDKTYSYETVEKI